MTFFSSYCQLKAAEKVPGPFFARFVSAGRMNSTLQAWLDRPNEFDPAGLVEPAE